MGGSDENRLGRGTAVAWRHRHFAYSCYQLRSITFPIFLGSRLNPSVSAPLSLDSITLDALDGLKNKRVNLQSLIFLPFDACAECSEVSIASNTVCGLILPMRPDSYTLTIPSQPCYFDSCRVSFTPSFSITITGHFTAGPTFTLNPFLTLPNIILRLVMFNI